MRRLLGVGLAVVLGGCGGSGGGGGTGVPTPVFTTLSVSPTSATLAGAPGSTTQLTATPEDQNGHAMSGLGSPTWASSDESVATVDGSGLVTSVAVGGPVTITASLTASSVTKQGTSSITVTDIPDDANVTATTSDTFSPGSVDIRAGGTVTWAFQSVNHTVTFDNRTSDTPDDIPSTANASVSRTFSTPGTYPYHCTIHAGMSGTVVVH